MPSDSIHLIAAAVMAFLLALAVMVPESMDHLAACLDAGGSRSACLDWLRAEKIAP